jgi:hypothetical protein
VEGAVTQIRSPQRRAVSPPGRSTGGKRIGFFSARSHWLGDSVSVMFQHEGSLHMTGRRDRRIREVFSVCPYEVDDVFGISADNRAITFGLVVALGDICMDVP